MGWSISRPLTDTRRSALNNMAEWGRLRGGAGFMKGKYLAKVLGPFYDTKGSRSGHGLLCKLEDAVEGKGGDIADITHRLTGDANMACAVELAAQIQHFSSGHEDMSYAEKIAFVRQMKATLDASREEMIAKGELGPDGTV